MDKEAPMEVVAINSDDDEVPDKPIIQLFKRLIFNDNKQSTVLTNAQIVDILDKEFSINLWDIHELEGEIYLTIMKKYLKDWPQWDDFDKNINTLKSKDNVEKLNKMLEANYQNLKEYLRVIIERSQTLAKSTVNKLIKDKTLDAKALDTNDSKSDNIVLEIKCSRNQLNQLFFRRPNPSLNDSIFNGANVEPTQIKLNSIPLEAILNWWEIKITIQRGSTFFYERKTVHKLNHVLVNKNLMARYNPLKVLPQEIQISRSAKADKSATASMHQYIAYVDSVLMKENPTLVPLLTFIRKDMRLLPDKVIPRSSYRRYTNKYPYIRYLYTDVRNPDINSRKYDLQLEETVSPIYRVYLGPVQLSNASVEVECVQCVRKFSGPDLVEELVAHFDELHTTEPDWKCTNCGKTFPMATLASTWWMHKC
ncbi:uncharacterized protein LOC120635330 [Pararge aegeria]|uniref:Jg25705 protein n=2 Tax=Pararge aegeria TaxID=116150 RepID=A0A8S4RQU9_9NEOP|nr:uncharacterized protein LOC120635330 [Pararge aegeria]CAH2240681.1 jg25705 [Pararge aegeria aegeria]